MTVSLQASIKKNRISQESEDLRVENSVLELHTPKKHNMLQVTKGNNFIFCLLLTCIQVQAYADFQPPKIYPQTPADHILVQAGQTAKLICRGTLKGVTWFLPTDATDSMRRRLQINHHVDHAYFESQLQIRDLDYQDTGTLICAYNGTTDLTSIDNSSKIHLYVEDKKHILKESGFDYMQAIQSETFVLPCMPTHPDVNLSLWRGGQKVNDKYITFDPKVNSLRICLLGKIYAFRLLLFGFQSQSQCSKIHFAIYKMRLFWTFSKCTHCSNGV